MRDRLKMQIGTTVNLAGVINFTSAASAGLFSKAATTPFERVYEKSVINKTSFFTQENFKNPLQGLKAALVIGPALSAEFFTTQDLAKKYLNPGLQNYIGLSAPAAQFVASACAGSVHGVFVNGVSAVQTQTWEHAGTTLAFNARQMAARGGIKPFIKGAGLSVPQGMLFGATYQTVRDAILESLPAGDGKHVAMGASFFANTTAATTAAVVASPFSYIRTIQRATDPSMPAPSIKQIGSTLLAEVKSQATISGKLGLFSRRLNLGPSAARVAIGLAVGQTIYDAVNSRLKEMVAESPSSAPSLVNRQ